MYNLVNLVSSPHYLSFKATKGSQFGQNVITLQCTADQLIKFFLIDKSVQRTLDEIHVSNIQKYIQFGLDGNDIYFPPLLFSSRGLGEYNDDEKKYYLKLDDRLVVLDGQHRLKAFEMIIKRLETRKDEASREQLKRISKFPLTIQIFTDLTKKQERQLFTDINTKASKVSNTLLLMYSRESLSTDLIKEIIHEHPTVPEDIFETRARSTRTKVMTAATLNNLIIALNEGRLNTAMTEIKVNKKDYTLYRDRTNEFLRCLVKYAPGDGNDRDKYFIYVPSNLYGMAYFIFNALEKEPFLEIEHIFERIISLVDWTHNNKDLGMRGIPFNTNTRKFNFSNGMRGSRVIAAYLEEIFEGNDISG